MLVDKTPNRSTNNRDMDEKAKLPVSESVISIYLILKKLAELLKIFHPCLQERFNNKNSLNMLDRLMNGYLVSRKILDKLQPTACFLDRNYRYLFLWTK